MAKVPLVMPIEPAVRSSMPAAMDTARLTLRRPRLADAASIFDGYA